MYLRENATGETALAGFFDPDIPGSENRMRLLEEGDLCGGEDLLFETAEEGGLGCLEAGVDFYARLNELSDAQLEEAGFGRDEIQEGLQDLSDHFGVVL